MKTLYDENTTKQILNRAIELNMQNADKLSSDDIQAIATELGVSESELAQAVEEVTRQQATESATEVEGVSIVAALIGTCVVGVMVAMVLESVAAATTVTPSGNLPSSMDFTYQLQVTLESLLGGVFGMLQPIILLSLTTALLSFMVNAIKRMM